MLILITGVPGSGKTLYAVDLLENYRKENEELIKIGSEPRAIYSDIDGIQIDGVLPAPDDWRECPDGSLVFYDECQQKFGPDGQGRSSRADIQEFETHRHRGFDIILITQHPKLLHAHIRRLVGRHYHVFRMYGTQNAKIFSRDGQIDIDKPAQLNQQDSYVWTYPKQHFDKYKSATIHTHKKSFPKWMKRSLYGAIAIIAIMSFLIPKAMPILSGSTTINALDDNRQEQADFAQSLPFDNAASSDVSFFGDPVACISNSESCNCYSTDGRRMNILYLQCLKYTEGALQYLHLTPPARNRAVARSGG